jgi:hypothetical protein
MGTLPAYGIYARHVRDLELANINVSFATNDLRPAAAFADIDGLDIDHLQAKVAGGVKAAQFGEDVRNLTVRNSPLIK